MVYTIAKELNSFDQLGLPSKFRSEKIPQKRHGTVFVIPQNKVLIPCDSKYFGMIRNGIPRFFLFRKLFGTDFRGFSLPKIVRNRIPRVFLIQKWFGTEFQGFFSSEKWFRMEFRAYFSSKKWFGTAFWGFFSFEKWFGTELWGFFFCETGGIPTELPSVPSCSVSCGIIFLSENGNPITNPCIFKT